MGSALTRESLALGTSRVASVAVSTQVDARAELASAAREELGEGGSAGANWVNCRLAAWRCGQNRLADGTRTERGWKRQS